MKRLIVMVSLLLLGLGSGEVSAQDRTVSGRVTAAETGQPLAGVRVMAKGTRNGTLTTAEGRYTLSVPASATALVFSSLTHASVELPITGAVVNAEMTAQALSLEGLVVTALGQERERESLGTAVQQVETSPEIPESNLVSALSGKVSGVNIVSGGQEGGAARIVIRGANSITGNNQPLFVINGVPIDNSFTESAFRGFGEPNYQNKAADINPNDIESITVLKGPNAAAIYGSRAANGAILITTKSGVGADGLGITASQTVSFETPLRLPRYQNEYGQGFDGQFSYVDGAGGGVYDDKDESWGPRLDGRVIPQWNSPVVNGVRQATPWVAAENSVRDFFETGQTLTTNVAFARAFDAGNFRLGFTRMDQDGMYPGFGLNRNNVTLSGGVNLADNLRADASMMYIATGGENRAGNGYEADNPMLQFVWFGRQVDVADLREAYENERVPYSWNSNYHMNPYWIALENRNWDDSDRFIGSATLAYDVLDGLTLTGRAGTDFYEDVRMRTYAAGSFGIYAGPNGNPVGENGAFAQDRFFRQETNADLILNGRRDLSDDFTFDGTLGAATRLSDYTRNFAYAEDLSVPGIYNLGNAKVTPNLTHRVEEKQVNSVYGQASFGFRGFWFLDLTGRNDWSSTLPDDHNSYFYPSVSSSLVFSDLVEIPGLDQGKVRASWARVGNDADPYQLETVYTAQDPIFGLPAYAVPNTQANFELRPEETTSIEVGTELGFLDGRLGLDFTYYTRETTDQIIPVQVSATSGFEERVLNAGTISNRGVELLVSTVPVALENGLRWESTLNFARNENEVEELFPGVDALVLDGFFSMQVQARKGEPYGTLWGRKFQRDAQGRVVVDERGVPLADPKLGIIGNYNPDWTGGWFNRLSFGGFDVSALLDVRKGGEFYSGSHRYALWTGVLQETVEGREDLNGDGRADGVLWPNSVKVTAAGDTVANDIRVDPQLLYREDGIYAIHEGNTLDAGFVKLRELKLGYTLPESLLDRMGVSFASIALVGRNLALWTDNPHYDPESGFDAGNAQGIEFGQLPSARSLGFTVTIRP